MPIACEDLLQVGTWDWCTSGRRRLCDGRMGGRHSGCAEWTNGTDECPDRTDVGVTGLTTLNTAYLHHANS